MSKNIDCDYLIDIGVVGLAYWSTNIHIGNMFIIDKLFTIDEVAWTDCIDNELPCIKEK